MLQSNNFDKEIEWGSYSYFNVVKFIQSTVKKLVEFLPLKIHSQRFHTSFIGSLAARFCPLPLRFVNNCLANSRF